MSPVRSLASSTSFFRCVIKNPHTYTRAHIFPNEGTRSTRHIKDLFHFDYIHVTNFLEQREVHRLSKALSTAVPLAPVSYPSRGIVVYVYKSSPEKKTTPHRSAAASLAPSPYTRPAPVCTVKNGRRNNRLAHDINPSSWGRSDTPVTGYRAGKSAGSCLIILCWTR